MKDKIIVTTIEGKFRTTLYGKGISLYNPDKFFNSLTETDKDELIRHFHDNKSRLDKILDWFVGNPPDSQYAKYIIRADFDAGSFSLHKYPSRNTLISKVNSIGRIVNDSQLDSELLSASREKSGDSMARYTSYPYLNEFSRLITYEDFIELVKKGFEIQHFTLPFDTDEEQLRDYIAFYISIKNFKNEHI